MAAAESFKRKGTYYEKSFDNSSMTTVLVLAGLATGCSKDTPEPVTGIREVFAPNFNSTESAKMGSYMYNGRYLITDEYAYYGLTDNLYWSKSVKIENDEIRKITSSDSEYKSAKFTEFPQASYFTQTADGTIYFLSKEGEIVKTTPGSENFDIVFNPGATTLQIDGEKIWYTKTGADKFFCAGLDGNDEEKILDKAVYYPYVVGNFVIYQDDADGESLHIYDMAMKEDKKILDGPVHSPNIVGNWIFCLVKDRETGFSQIVGVEFQESGEFSSKVFNLNGQYWYADASLLHAVIRETASDNTMMELIFHGKNVKNYGEADQSIDEEKEIQGAIPAWLLYNPNYSINWENNYVYSSPYSFMLLGELDNHVYLNLHDRTHVFKGFYEEGSRTENEIKEWLEKSGQTE